MKILVLAAHPDDEVLGCGGTIARLSAEGHSVIAAILGEGITSRYSQRDLANKEEIRILHERSHNAAKLLGIEELEIFDLPDNRFDTVPLLDIVKILEKLIETWNPDCVYTHNSSDLNQDHNLISRATMIATRPLEGTSIKTVLSYEIPSSTEWAFRAASPAFLPNVFVDISSTLETKLKAMQIYDSEMRVYPHPRSPEALRSIASRWGSVSGTRAAEAFELIRHISS